MNIELGAADLGLLLIRSVIGLLLAGHGAQKLFGWFGGDGLSTTGDQMRALGYPKSRLMALIAGLTEVAAGLGLALGFATPLVAAAIIGTMLNAALSAHIEAGLWNHNGGYEYPLVLSSVAAALALQGPGALSVDAALSLEASGLGLGLGAIGLGLFTAAAVLGTRRRSSTTNLPRV